MIFKEIDGNIFEEIEKNKYDVIIQGCNCFSRQGSGIAVKFVEVFGTDGFEMEYSDHPFNFSNVDRYNKLGCIDYQSKYIDELDYFIEVVNCYTQYYPGADARYNAIGMCFDKLNFVFKGKDLITPQIGCGIGGLSIDVVKKLIHTKLKELNSVTLVNYKN